MTNKVHNLKIKPNYYHAICNGERSFDLRLNDRNFEVGDKVILHEYHDSFYTGGVVEKVIEFMMFDFEGLVDGYVILGLKDGRGK